MKILPPLFGAFFLTLFLLTGLTGVAAQANERSFAHPLDDLTKEEIAQTVSLIKASKKFSDETRFVYVMTKEPAKQEILSSTTLSRKSLTVLYDRAKDQTWEVIVDLSLGAQGEMVSARVLEGVQPPLLVEEYEMAPKIVLADPRWQEALKKRGIMNFEDVYHDTWAPGLLSAEEIKSKKRLHRIIPFYKGKGKFNYGRPIEGLIATVDLKEKKVVEIWDTGIVPIVSKVKELDERSNEPLRTDLKPLMMAQPEGPSFKVEGQKVTWQNWVFRFSMQPMKGLVLYQISYKDKAKAQALRSVLYKANLSEMLVPYGEQDKTWTFRNAFDVGEYGMGVTAHPLQPIIDVPETAVLFNFNMVDNSGEHVSIPNAMAMYERDGGVLWKHYDSSSTISEGRRGRQLVVMFMTTIGNYDYGFNWIFHQDGTLEMEANFTGIMLSKGTPLTQNTCEKECKFLVEPMISAPAHQHFFSFRLDLDVDGSQGNTPVEINSKAMPMGKNNPVGNIFKAEQTFLKSEKSGVRDLNLASSRKWKVINSDVKNTLGHPVGFALLPGENAIPFLNPKSPVRQKAGFINHHVWFTRFQDQEQSAAGDFPNQNHAKEGLESWTKDNAPLEKQDVVLWYTMGATHITRPEDWPVMPVHRAGFKLIPVNFFNENPAMDVPVSR